jgi:hypothetical protein
MTGDEVVVAYFKVLFQHLIEELKNSTEHVRIVGILAKVLANRMQGTDFTS